MALLKRAGTFLATPKAWGVDVEKTPTFVIQFAIDGEKQGTEWVGVEADLTVTGYINLVKRDDSLNEINIKSLADSLGWDGGSFDTLDNGDWSQTQVQIVVEIEDYNGQQRTRVQYINPRDYSGRGVKKAEPAKVKSLDAKYGALLRKTFGTKPPAAKPSVTNGVQANPAEVAKAHAWSALKDRTTHYTPDDQVAAWRKCVTAVYPGREAASLTAAEWQQVKASIERDFNAAAGELLPI